MRNRLVGFAIVAILVVAGTTVALLHERSAGDTRTSPTASRGDAIRSGPHIVFRDNDRSHYGKVAMVALSDPSGPRFVTDRTCERVDAVAEDGGEYLCLSLDRGTVSYRSQLLDSRLRVVRALPLGGIPSRARLSADGRLAASTSFTAVGDSYASTSFSTRTFVSRTSGSPDSLNLESLKLVHNGRSISPRDRNYWGVTFTADDRTFYATVAFGGHTWLVHGDLERRRTVTLREDAECPSLSPDGRTLVYKKREGRARGDWRLAALDLASGRETPLPGNHTVDDQVAWLDDGHVMYALQGTTGDPYLYDVYTVPVDGSGTPRLLIRHASSPEVVR